MTFKLVTLMIVVLVITLSAFAGLMAYTQAQVMDELLSTVSAVGRATLHSLEAGLAPESEREAVVEWKWKTRKTTRAPRRIVVRINGSGGAPRIDEEDESVIVLEPEPAGTEGKPPAAHGLVIASGDLASGELEVRPEPAGTEGKPAATRELVIAEVDLAGGGLEVRPEPTATEAEPPAVDELVVAEGELASAEPEVGTEPTATDADPPSAHGLFVATGDLASGRFEIRREETGGDGEAPVWRERRELRRDGNAVVEERYVIAVDEVSAEKDPSLGMVLRIPTLDDDGPGAGEKPATIEAGALPALSRRRDIVLPVPTREFEHLFASLSRRSIYIFLAVLLVGSVLSAGLATRFTRPVRRLDDAFRRLSEGDLDVAVPPGGRDEIGRLTSRFNEMAAALRRHRQRNRELARREKLSALGQLAAGVAHDVRNPLHSIGLTLDELRESCRPGDTKRQQEFDRCLGILRQELERLDGLVTNFLRFTRRQPRERMPIDAGELSQHVVQLVEHQARRREVGIEAQIDPDAGEIEADGEALQAALLNVVLNALEAMPDGGRLRLVCGGDERLVRFEVEDEGQGIPPADLDRAFEFGYTTKEDGHGLGLAMVHQIIVEEHGGQVELTSEEGRGSQVRMLLPRRAGTRPAGGEA